MKKLKVKPIDLFLIIIAVFLAGFVLGNYNSPFYRVQTVKEETIKYVPLNVSADGHKVEMPVPAVDSEGSGVSAKLTTSVRPGTGLVLVAVNSILAEYSTQYSGRVAAGVAGNYTGFDMNNFDVIYAIEVNATAIEGPSAGAAMAVSIIAALQNKTLPKDVMITGTINSDGTIGPAGAIAEKAKAAKESGAGAFLVPKGQSYEYSNTTREKSCKSADGAEYCTVNYSEKKVNIGERLNMTIAEVSDINEAMKYFFASS